MTPAFSERQHFTTPWLWALILGLAALFTYGAWRQLILGEPWGTKPGPDWAILMSWLFAGVALPALFASAHLRTEVRGDGIRIRFFPFHLRWRNWSYSEIESVEAREYSPLGEFGGWGIRIAPQGWAYNVSGRLGIQLVLRSGQWILIGTRDPEGFLATVREVAGGRASR
jgi:hypothetical protein